MIFNFNIKSFFKPAYLFNPYPGTNFGYYLASVVVFGLLLVCGITLLVIALRIDKKNPKRKLFKKFSDLGFTIGIIGFILLFFRYENVAYLSSRFLLLLLLIIVLVWLSFIIFYILRRYPKERVKYQEYLRISKYLKKSR